MPRNEPATTAPESSRHAGPETLLGLLDGNLSKARAAAAEAHLGTGCEACLRRLERLRPLATREPSPDLARLLGPPAIERLEAVAEGSWPDDETAREALERAWAEACGLNPASVPRDGSSGSGRLDRLLARLAHRLADLAEDAEEEAAYRRRAARSERLVGAPI